VFCSSQQMCALKKCNQGGHQPGKVGEFYSGQGKVRESEKSRCVTAIAMVTE